MSFFHLARAWAHLRGLIEFSKTSICLDTVKPIQNQLNIALIFTAFIWYRINLLSYFGNICTDWHNFFIFKLQDN